ncbi:MAG TPA: radical SAM protein [Patescibacteria group bacterium]|nr:radical SAM protein [Patescibacteria group bacterium]
MTSTEKVYSAPTHYIVVPRNDWYVFFDPLHFSFTRVNEHGKAILESVGQESTAPRIAERVAKRFGYEPGDIENGVAAFLEDMTATKFIHEGPYKPRIAEPPDLEHGRPGTLYVHPTYSCNLSCIYCYNKKERKVAPVGELTTRDWFGIFDQAKELGIHHIVFTGGEPLLRYDIFELARYVNDAGMTGQLLTNGLLVGGHNIDEIMKTFGAVGFSIDSHIREKNDSLRGKGAFDATVNAMRIMHANDFSCTAKAVITKHNVDELPDLYRFFLEEFGSSNLIPNLFIPPVREMIDLLPALEDYLEAMNRVGTVVEDFYGDDKASILRFHGIPARQYQCGAGAGEISLGPDGSVYPCQALHKDEFHAGTITERSLREIYYDSPVLKKLRGCTVDSLETCRDCDVKYLCGGGCRSLAYNLFGEIDCHNSYSCEYLRSLAYAMLWNSSCVPVDQLRALQREQKKAGIPQGKAFEKEPAAESRTPC